MSLIKKIIITLIFLISYLLGSKDSKANILQSNLNYNPYISSITLNNSSTFSNFIFISNN